MNSLIGSDWCVVLASLTPSYIVMGGQSFHLSGGRRGRRASWLINKARSTIYDFNFYLKL